MAKRPREPVQLAKQVFDIAIGEAEDGNGCDPRSTLQLRQNPQDAANHSRNGLRPERSCLESGRNRDDG